MVNIWCSVIGNTIIKQYFINGMLNNIKHDNFICNDFGIWLKDVQLNTCRIMWYQHDGCLVHYGHKVRTTLNEMFPNRWIRRSGPISWPARSPDITLLDYFLWGTLKIIVYQDRPTTSKNMKQRIIAAYAKISPEEWKVYVFQELNDCTTASM